MKRKNIVILFVALIVLIVHICPFIIHNFSNNVHSEITSDGLLDYIGNCAGSLISALIAIYALMQTGKANDISKRLLELEEMRKDIELKPTFAITNWSALKKQKDEIYDHSQCLNIEVGKCNDDIVCGIELEIMNTSEGFEFLWYDCAKSMNGSNEWINSMTGMKTRKLEIPAQEKKSIFFYAGKDFWENSKKNLAYKLMFNIRNRLDMSYKGCFDMMIFHLDFDNQSKSNIYLEIQNYNIEKVK